jgi:FtsP/CotA-like multicopper oxidase with cupredoxin domain
VLRLRQAFAAEVVGCFITLSAELRNTKDVHLSLNTTTMCDLLKPFQMPTDHPACWSGWTQTRKTKDTNQELTGETNMKQTRTLTLSVAGAALLWGISPTMGQYVPPPQLAPGVDYTIPNYANSPALTKFIDPLPGVKAAGAAVPGFYFNGAVNGRNIPVAVADTAKFAGSAYYEIALVDYTETLHSELGPTQLRGYVQIEPPGSSTTPAGSLHVLLPGVTIGNAPVYAYDAPTYLGPIIVATQGQATRVKFYNLLPANGGNLFIPTDITVMGAGMGPDGSSYSQNRATLHLHGGDNPWISDGTAHQWITPAGQSGTLIKGVSQQNVPDMPAPGAGSATFYWPNGQSGRLMFYHDHALGMTRLNVYAGEAAGYLLADGTEVTINAFAPGGEIPLVIQDKSFVNDGAVPAAFPAGAAAPAATAVVDPLWATHLEWGQSRGSLWWPHVYMPNQNPNDLSGANPMGRVDYGAWFWPVFPVSNPMPEVSIVPEGFMDTPVINGAAYPKLDVDPMPYRFRILNACNDRFVNLQLYVAASSIVGGINIASGGSGYTAAPRVTITPAAGDTTGQGAVAVATVDLNQFLADGVSPNPAFGTVTAVDLTVVGSGYTAAPTVTIAPPISGVQATATATLYTLPTEVGMVPADINSATTTWPAGWTVQTPGMIPDIIDNRPGGLPDPRNIGPNFIQIGTEGGLLPAPAVLPVTPVGYVQNKRDITVGSVGPNEHTLLLGPAERGDVIIDFSQYVGKTLILYSDSPAPVPAGDPRNDYYTAGPDMTGQGGTPPTQPGFGPNTRTLMQITVSSAAPTALNLSGLTAAMATAWTARAEPLIVPANVAAKISDTSLTFNGGTQPLQPKTIQELFDPTGRMNATLGVEIPFTTATVQTTIPYGFSDPATEVIPNGATQLWKITHNGVDTHAIHFHLFNVQLVNRVGWDGAIRFPEPNELGWKETVRMNPLEDIVVALKAKVPTVPAAMGTLPNNTRPLDPTQPANFSFTGVVDPNGNPVAAYPNSSANFGNEYTWHCHLLGHEENDMMRPVLMAVPPLAPQGLSFVTVKNNKGVLVANLTWADSSPDETGYMVQKKTGTGPWVTIASLTAGTLAYTDTTFKQNTGSQYQVLAVNAVGSGVAGFPGVVAYSPPSNIAAAPLGTTIIPLTVLVGTPPATTTVPNPNQAGPLGSPVIVKWSYNAIDQTGFTVQRSTSSTFPATSATATFTVAASAGSFTDTAVVTGLKKNTAYYYRVTPFNINGTGLPSNTGTILVHP